MTSMLALALLLGAPPTLEEGATGVFERVSPSVVAVRAMATLGERSGAGVVLSEDGLILTSYSIIPSGSTRIQVWLSNAEFADGEIVGHSPEDEVTLIRVHVDHPLTPIALGTDAGAPIGMRVYTIGNPNNAFINDDQPAMSIGVVSGRYSLATTRGGATYVGPVLETTAAVNPGSAGGPLVNARGEMVGLVTMNFSSARWMGYAIPIDWVRHAVDRIRPPSESDVTDQPLEGDAYVGFTVRDEDGRVVVADVDPDSPADRAGLSAGDAILALGRRRVVTAQELTDILAQLAPGDVLPLRVETERGEIEVHIDVEARQ